MELQILFEDEHLVAINKEPGLSVHKTEKSPPNDVVALQLVRKQIKARVYPIHRLDKRTSGFLIFGKSSKMAHEVHTQIQNREVTKKYWVVTYNHTPLNFSADHVLTNAKGKAQDAFTEFKTFAHATWLDKDEQEHKFSFIEAIPHTGRMHQIRKHLNLLGFPILGDTIHGYMKLNRLLMKQTGLKTMMLHSRSYQFSHPADQSNIIIEAPLMPSFEDFLILLGLSKDNAIV